MDVSVILKTVISLIASLITLISSITPTPPAVDDDNTNTGGSENNIFHNTTITQVEFDEGEFKTGKYDLIVSPDGSDTNKGTLESPLKTLNGAKEKLKALEEEVLPNSSINSDKFSLATDKYFSASLRIVFFSLTAQPKYPY